MYGGEITLAVLWTATGLTGFIWLVTTDAFVERLPIQWRGWRRHRLPPQPAIEQRPPEQAVADDAPPAEFTERELAAITDRNRERVFLTNVQLVIDELAEARRVIFTGVDEGGYWDQELVWDVWHNVRGSFVGQKGFTTAYNATREAYEALINAELMRRNYEPRYSEDPMLGRSARILQETVDKMDAASRELLDFLALREF